MVASSPCVDVNMIMRCTNSQGGQPTSSGVCVGQQGRPSCACSGTVIPSLSLCPSLFAAIHTYLSQYWSLSCDHGLVFASKCENNYNNNSNNNYLYDNTCTWGARATYGASYVWLSSGSCCVRKGRCNDCSERIRI